MSEIINDAIPTLETLTYHVSYSDKQRHRLIETLEVGGCKREAAELFPDEVLYELNIYYLRMKFKEPKAQVLKSVSDFANKYNELCMSIEGLSVNAEATLLAGCERANRRDLARLLQLIVKGNELVEPIISGLERPRRVRQEKVEIVEIMDELSLHWERLTGKKAGKTARRPRGQEGTAHKTKFGSFVKAALAPAGLPKVTNKAGEKVDALQIEALGRYGILK